MPAVFSPGEAETRPVDPDAIVYTTGDKVGELLGIAPGEPVLAAANSSATGFYITGTDLREHGFEKDDSIFVFSDLYPLGETFTIGTPVVEDVSGTKYVKLPVTLDSGAAGTNDAFASYTTAANTEIQNKTVFTNGKKRGVTKDIVNKHIRRIQDRIDNYTHNAWRPYLVSAEYLNFDTYKPYRRRYYTDYVGTTPLLFRNVQQILRIEMWQGQDYREICGAEARIQLPDDLSTTDGNIAISPGNGSAALLSIGTSSTTWRKDFDKVTAAQNLADLINKEDRVNKAAVEFSPAFTLEGSTSNIAVHNEFLASANSDYGNGKLKVTSMRQTKGGETCSIVASSGITLSQTKTATATFVSLASDDITVDSTEGFLNSGVCIDASGDIFRYESKDATRFLTCTSVTGGGGLGAVTGTITQHIFQLDLQAGSTSGDQARLKDWWLDHEMGIIYFNNSYPFFEYNSVKVSYIYGERYLEKAIEEAATKLVASELLMSDDRSVLIPEGTQNIDLGSKAQLFRREAMDILSRYKEVVVFS
jgi:hypothetical protein|tara:strand:+ start:5601 stop:7199 length:1599 start_codon:yes stop_codon:yes gene_type:complete